MLDEETLDNLYDNYMKEISPYTNEFYNLAPSYLFGNNELSTRLEFLRSEIFRTLKKHLEIWKGLGIIKNYLVTFNKEDSKIEHKVEFSIEYSNFFEKHFPGIKDLKA